MNTININDIANWTIIIGYSSITIFAVIMTFVSKGESKKKRAFFKESILTKHKNNIEIDADEFMRMIESSKIGKLTAEDVLSELLLAASTPEDHRYYSELVQKVETIEPFDVFSKDIRVVLKRLNTLTKNCESESDKLLLIPIRNALEKADEIKNEQKRTKKINTMLTIVGLISFALSIGGLYVSLKSPSKEDIASIIKNELQNIKKVQ